VGGWLLRHAVQRRWLASSFEGLVIPCLTALALAFAAYLGGNQFIACFVGGIALGFFIQTFGQPLTGFAETLTNLLGLLVFLFVGTKMVVLWQTITWEIVLYALLSLTLVRVLPVAFALMGSGLRRESVLFVGWSGPRGLVSIVLALVVVAALYDIPHRNVIVTTVVTTVSLSVVLHGISGLPLVSWYGRRMEALGAEAPENRPVADIPFRLGWSHLADRSDARVSAWEARRAARSQTGGDANHL
jgi:NhaP-type Na+/H+ or K+/H+ antiporter